MVIAIPGYFGLFSKEYVVDYAANLEVLLKRAVDYAQQRQEPVSVCFALSKACNAEGIMSYKNPDQAPQNLSDWNESLNQSKHLIEDSANWQLIEALPLSEKVSLSSNFFQQRLMIRSDGLGVFQPGSIYLCSLGVNAHELVGQRLVIARSGRIRREAMLSDDILKYCEN